MEGDGIQREILPILDISPVGLTTYDAKDPVAVYPSIVPVRPPPGPPIVLFAGDRGLPRGIADDSGGRFRCPYPELVRPARVHA